MCPVPLDQVVRVEKASPEGVVLLDSPHSGVFYPANFDHACSRELLRTTEDALVHELFAECPAMGATLIHAQFARSFVDVNRSADDIESRFVDISPGGSGKADRGIGLIWRHVNGVPIYNSAPSPADVESRIRDYWTPYREGLKTAWDRVVSCHGYGIHLNCHSMPSRDFLYEGPFGGVMPYDFILGDRGGTTAAESLTGFVAEFLRARGWKVAVNVLFSGADIVRSMGAPQRGRHSLQIEINRALYLDESSGEPLSSFGAIRTAMTELVNTLLQRTKP